MSELNNNFKENELNPLATVKEYLTVQNEGELDAKSNVQNLHIAFFGRFNRSGKGIFGNLTRNAEKTKSWRCW